MTIRETVPAVMLSSGSREDGQISDCHKTLEEHLNLDLGIRKEIWGGRGGLKNKWVLSRSLPCWQRASDGVCMCLCVKEEEKRGG